LSFSSVAQEDPAVVIYLNEQIRAYDRRIMPYANLIANSEEEFASLSEAEKKDLLEEMSRTNTIMHELSHIPYIDGSPESEHLGAGPLVKIDEVKAETLYRALVPRIVEKGGLRGTKEQWAVGMLASSLTILRDNPSDDEYYYSVSYALNELFNQGAIDFQNDKLKINDFAACDSVYNSCAREVISLYQSEKIKEPQAARWIKEKCSSNAKTRQLEEFLKNNKELP
jgi:hypothetical protein